MLILDKKKAIEHVVKRAAAAATEQQKLPEARPRVRSQRRMASRDGEAATHAASSGGVLDSGSGASTA